VADSGFFQAKDPARFEAEYEMVNEQQQLL
jgi:hypothetical protein